MTAEVHEMRELSMDEVEATSGGATLWPEGVAVPSGPAPK
jgi:hypothetical protein